MIQFGPDTLCVSSHCLCGRGPWNARTRQCATAAQNRGLHPHAPWPTVHIAAGSIGWTSALRVARMVHRAPPPPQRCAARSGPFGTNFFLVKDNPSQGTTNRHQPPTANCRQPPAATNQPPIATNHHQPPPTNSRRQPPPIANCHQPWLNIWATRSLFAKLLFRNTFFFHKDPPVPGTVGRIR